LEKIFMQKPWQRLIVVIAVLAILDEPYEVVPSTEPMEEVRLDNDSYFILGDNRPDSLDSSLFGPVKGDAIKGKAIPE
jgi:type IV secretory pathway protease TraF